MPRYPPKNGLLDIARHEPSPTASLQDTPQVTDAKHALRTDWKWAYVSHFIYVFDPMLLLLEHLSISDVEDDLAAGTSLYTPRAIIRLLTCLTHDRKISLENYERVLYRQYLRRSPESLPTLVTQSFVEKPKPKTRSPSPVQSSKDDGTPAEDIKKENGEDDDEAMLETEEKIEWTSLSLQQRLDILYDICEWQFQNPTRLRTSMKHDDDYATWRIEPFGYDASLNSYYLLGGDRVWIQRALPKKARKATKKAKSTAPTKTKGESSTSKPAKVRKSSKPPLMINIKKRPPPPPEEPLIRASKRIRKSVSATPSVLTGTRNSTPTTRSGRPSRAAANDAKMKLAALPQTTMNPRSTRASARIRGAPEEDVWQEIPDEWLHPEHGSKGAREEFVQPTRRVHSQAMDDSDAGQEEQDGEEDTQDEEEEDEEEEDEAPDFEAHGGLGEGSDLTSLSELSDLSDEEEDEDEQVDEDDDEEKLVEDAEPELNEKKLKLEAEEQDPPLPPGFIEWETIVITLQEWENFPLQFEGSTNYLEKNFYKNLIHPEGAAQFIILGMKEAMKKKQQVEAVTHRKRSSRLAIKESEKEVARIQAAKTVEIDEKMSRAQRAEARAKKEEEARLERERQREERAARAERGRPDFIDIEAYQETEELQPKQPQAPSQDPKAKTGKGAQKSKKGAKKAGPSTPVRRATGAIPGANASAEDWELDCELCGMKGVNVNDGNQITCCENCGKWQHVWCHNQSDNRAGKPPRDWETTEFRCFDCNRAARQGMQPHQSVKLKLHPPTETKAVRPITPNQPLPPSQHLAYPYQRTYPHPYPTYQSSPYSTATSNQYPYPAQHGNLALPLPSNASRNGINGHQPRLFLPPPGSSQPITFAPNVSAENYTNRTMGKPASPLPNPSQSQFPAQTNGLATYPKAGASSTSAHLAYPHNYNSRPSSTTPAPAPTAAAGPIAQASTSASTSTATPAANHPPYVRNPHWPYPVEVFPNGHMRPKYWKPGTHINFHPLPQYASPDDYYPPADWTPGLAVKATTHRKPKLKPQAKADGQTQPSS